MSVSSVNQLGEPRLVSGRVSVGRLPARGFVSLVAGGLIGVATLPVAIGLSRTGSVGVMVGVGFIVLVSAEVVVRVVGGRR
jgi:hypothetical protein